MVVGLWSIGSKLHLLLVFQQSHSGPGASASIQFFFAETCRVKDLDSALPSGL